MYVRCNAIDKRIVSGQSNGKAGLGCNRDVRKEGQCKSYVMHALVYEKNHSLWKLTILLKETNKKKQYLQKH